MLQWEFKEMFQLVLLAKNVSKIHKGQGQEEEKEDSCIRIDNNY